MTEQQREPSEKFIISGVAVYPKVNTPDTKFKAEGHYTARTRLDENFSDELMAKLLKLRDDKYDLVVAGINDKSIGPKWNPKERTSKLAALKKADVGATAETDKQGEETGYFLLTPKMVASGVSKRDKKPWARSPKIFDSKNKIMKLVPKIFGGTEWKVAVEAKAYFAPGTKDAPPVVGVTYYLDAIQILKLVKAGDRTAESYGFGEEEGGYEGEQEEEGQFGGDGTDAPATGSEGAAAPAAGDDF